MASLTKRCILQWRIISHLPRTRASPVVCVRIRIPAVQTPGVSSMRYSSRSGGPSARVPDKFHRFCALGSMLVWTVPYQPLRRPHSHTTLACSGSAHTFSFFAHFYANRPHISRQCLCGQLCKVTGFSESQIHTCVPELWSVNPFWHKNCKKIFFHVYVNCWPMQAVYGLSLGFVPLLSSSLFFSIEPKRCLCPQYWTNL